MNGRLSRRRFVVLPIVLLSILMPKLLSHWVVFEPWPTWQPLLVQLCLIVAMGAVVAAVVAGVLAWRGAAA